MRPGGQCDNCLGKLDTIFTKIYRHQNIYFKQNFKKKSKLGNGMSNCIQHSNCRKVLKRLISDMLYVITKWLISIKGTFYRYVLDEIRPKGKTFVSASFTQSPVHFSPIKVDVKYHSRIQSHLLASAMLYFSSCTTYQYKSLDVPGAWSWDATECTTPIVSALTYCSRWHYLHGHILVVGDSQ